MYVCMYVLPEPYASANNIFNINIFLGLWYKAPLETIVCRQITTTFVHEQPHHQTLLFNTSCPVLVSNNCPKPSTQ